MHKTAISPAIVLKQAEDHKNREFLVVPHRELVLTYGQFVDSACGLAGRLQDEGIGRGDRVIAILPNGPEFAVLYFAALVMGATVVPINPALHPRDVQFVIHNAGAKLILYSSETKHFLQGPKQPLDKIRSLALPHLNEPLFKVSWQSRAWRPLEGVTPDDILTIVFTSGTTAAPKAVAHTIGNLLGNASAFNATMGLGPSDRMLHVLPMAYSGGFFNTLISPFLAGASVVLTQGFSPTMALNFWKVPSANGVNALWVTPTILATVLKLDRDPANRAWCRDNIRKLFIGTAPLHPKLKADFEGAYGTPLLESYGLSETLLVTANSPKTGAVDGSVGEPLAGMGVSIRGADGRELPEGQEGEVFVRTPHLMAGYLDYEASVLLAPPRDWFATGDLGVFQANRLRITGRQKDVIIRGGLNISPLALEDVLLRHPSVDQAAVVGVPSEVSGEEVVAVCRLKAGLSWATEKPSLESYCKSSFTSLSRPSALLELDEFPLGPTGKVQKKAIREWAARQLAGAPKGPA